LVEAPDNRDEFNLVKQLELRLGRPGSAVYSLDYTLSTTQDGVGLTSAQETTRYNLVGTVTYQVKEIATGRQLATGKVTQFTGYSVGTVDTTVSPPSTSSTVSTSAARQDAYDRLMVMLADGVVTALIAASADWTK
jgi:LPS-assembly lipoprotein